MSKILLLVMVSLLTFSPSSLAGLSEPIVNYHIKAKLIPEEKSVLGEEELTWINDSNKYISELQFHLYLNAFKNSRSTFMKERGGVPRRLKSNRKNWGYIEIDKIQVKDGPDLTSTIEYIQPDDDNKDDQTVARVTLPKPVPPRGKITLHIDFYSKLSRVVFRSGYHKDFYFVAQWFPKIGVLWKGEWNCHQYHSNSEFFANFGVYRVEITVPEGFVLGATGKRIDATRNGDDTITYTHFQENVHDFAWTASPDFLEFRQEYSLENPPVNTEMILLIHPSHRNQRWRYLSSLKNAIEFYSQNYGPYPYPTITLVDPPLGGLGAGGMEYPTLFTSFAFSWMPKGVYMTEMVTIHEFGHGYWYGIVGSNEFEEAWLDEGINSYSEIKAMKKYYGEDSSMFNIHGVKISDQVFHRVRIIASSRLDPILKNSWEYYNGATYGINVYSKAAFMLLTLENYLGEDVMSDIMKTFYERWKFKHPTSQDFIALAEEVSGQDLSWFFDQFLKSPDKLDYAIGRLRSREVERPEGILEGEQGLFEETEREEAQEQDKMYRNEVVVVRKGELIFPQDILVTFEGGEEIREQWDGKERWKRFVYLKPYRLRSAQVDPDNKVLLDDNFLNNSRVLKPKKIPLLKCALDLMFKFQAFLAFVSF
ncbi:MAG: M1 family peptidase [Candidatus Aminicenantes bacterium]|nr:M1 family peptidase [Candidatus Aminicenantes bacterium]